MSDADKPATAPRDLLVLLTPSSKLRPGARFVLAERPVWLGRSSNSEVILLDDSVARHHARCERRGDVWWIEDMGSTGGTHVNGERIGRQHALQDGDTIQIGSALLRYLHGDDVEARYRAELGRLERIDPLTGVGNLFALREALDAEVALARQHGHDVSVAVIDIDHFRHLNDRLGHLVGDAVLAQLARFLWTQLGDAGALARHRGSAFALVLPETPGDEAVERCEAAREALAAHPMVAKGESVSVTASVGVASLGDLDPTGGDLLERAEQRAAEAKAAGRNRVRA